MGKIINLPSVFKNFHTDETLHLIQVGYHDFTFLRPIGSFRVQKFYTLHFVLSGKGTLETGGKTYRLHGGDLFFLPPDEKMRYFPDPEDPWEYVWFAFGKDSVLHLLPVAGFSPFSPVARCPSFDAVTRTLKHLVQDLEDARCNAFKALSYFFEIMNLMGEETPLTETEKIRRRIDETFSSPAFSVERLCREVGVSHAHLLRLFKKEYGKTLTRYVTKKRMDLAKELLATTDLTVASVALSCGFRDEVHFMKTFKQQVGIPCGAFRRQHTEKRE